MNDWGTKGRDPLVDFMRGISILIVLVHHFHLYYRLDLGFFATFIPVDFLRRLGRNGNYGVTIFFVISGFLITSTTRARFGTLKNLSVRTFYSFRVARIIPNILLMLGIVVAFALGGVSIFANDPGTAPFGVTILSILTFTHNVLMQKYGWFNYCLNTLWSLSVEEVFYLTFPLICLLLRREILILVGWFLFVIAGPIYRTHHLHDEITVLCGYLSCFDGIAIGCIAAILARRLTPSMSVPKHVRQIFSGVAWACIVTVYFYRGILGNAVFGISAMALSVGTILFLKDERASKNWFLSRRVPRLLQWFGKNSYELYLFHIVILAFMRTLIKRGALSFAVKPVWFLLFLVLSVLVAEWVSRFYAEPLNRKIRKFYSSA